MSYILKPGQQVRTETSGMTCEVSKFLGGGGQGEVYAAVVGGKAVALKWYYPASATAEQRAALEILAAMSAPSPKFLWPSELASAPGVGDYGYIMPLREARYRSIVDMMKRRIEPSFRALATAGLELAHSFLQLHARGLCYRDISFGNAFFDPHTGEVLICDNDNVTVDTRAQGAVYGTPRFMAPEIVRGDAVPSAQTDLFSLSVLLFYMFMMHHPLEGKREAAIRCLDLPAMRKLYGTEPLFIFDPADDANAPDATHQKNATIFWSIYPRFLRELFTKAFTEGLSDPQHGRVRESNWRGVMVRLRDSIIYCGHCKAENFYDADTLAATVSSGRGQNAGACWSCKRPLSLPPRIRIARSEVMLNHDAHLFPHHVDDERRYDFGQPLAEVTRHPTELNVWGLKNLSRQTWSATTARGELKDVAPGRSVTLARGTRINFGRAEGEITF
ncbi:MAG: eukaryotic-like serine/threonine-protein kinase [Pyrinomonadaceae bacterium]|nr:eukaryotic-like serine/threonine-protein kinase [Pyrinomonadaceae bacterium]